MIEARLISLKGGGWYACSLWCMGCALLLWSVSLLSFVRLLIFLLSSIERTCSLRLYFCLLMIRSRSLDIENLTIWRFRLSIPSIVANSGSLPSTDLFLLDSANFLASYLVRLLILRSGCLLSDWCETAGWLYFSVWGSEYWSGSHWVWFSSWLVPSQVTRLSCSSYFASRGRRSFWSAILAPTGRPF